MVKPTLAIVGRPNVGKSTLFNRIAGERISIVEDIPGVTRDRIYATGEWLGREFSLIDTGGIEISEAPFMEQIKQQAQIAIEEANVIIMVVSVQEGITDADELVARILHRSKKPVLLAVNKADNPEMRNEVYEFYSLGLGDPYPISSTHGTGLGDLLDKVLENFSEDDEEVEDDTIRFSFIGRPNVGKSSLTNALLGEERVIVSDIAGTTRDAIDTSFVHDDQKFLMIDTAGIRKRGKVYENTEKYSVLRALRAIERSDVVLMVLNAEEGIIEQDKKVAGYAHEAGKGVIIVVNKWDAIEKDTNTMKEYRRKLDVDFSFMSYAPIIFISAKTGQRLDQLFETIKQVANANAMRIKTGVLNDLLAQATTRVQPPTDKGKRLKIFYMTQASTKPPTFVCFVNSAQLFHFSYQRYLENQIRATFGLEGTPIRMVVRERGDK